MEKIHLKNIVKSFFLGIFIGIVLLFYDNGFDTTTDKFLLLLTSGGMGFIIGFITEGVTSILPISIAKPRNYFFINNLIALVVTSVIMLVSIMLTNNKMESYRDIMPVIGIVLGIVFLANGIDYMMYYRAQNKLKIFKELFKDK
ncbi:MAG: hypothetical protein CVV02_17365 [Firmicutes bacterium HGW-Firmicutes-7]|nr:MAG: hypothetical protein CVV02_17365 [Firmicutes bacterium HGW-Firmicutes-7]